MSLIKGVSEVLANSNFKKVYNSFLDEVVETLQKIRLQKKNVKFHL